MLSLKTFNFYYKIVYAFYLNTNCSVLIPVDYWSSVLILTLLSWCRSHRLRAQSYLRLSPLQTSVWSSWDSQDASVQFISVQSFSHVRLFATPWTAAHQASLAITSAWSLPKLVSIELVMPSNHLTLCCPFLPCLQSFPASGSFPMSQFFTSGGQSIGVLISASVLPMDIQDWFPLGLTGLISLPSRGPSRVFSNTIAKSINSSMLSFLSGPTLTSIHDYWKNHSFDYGHLSVK